MKGGALSGLTVLVTRPASQAEGLVEGLRRHGATVIAAPSIRIVDPISWRLMDQALKRLACYDALIFASANAVERFFLRAEKVLGSRPQKPRRIYAIGPRTAQSLKSHGWRGVGVPDRYEGKSLAHRIGSVKGWNILIPRASQAREALPTALRRQGAAVDVVDAYRTVVDPSGIQRIRRAVRDKVDMVTFASGSSAEHFARSTGPARARRFFRKAIAASIGPVTTAALRRLGIERVVQAKKYTSDGMIQAILAHYGKH